MIKARVYKSTGSHYIVKNEEGQMLDCVLRGKLKIDESITSSNPIAVGDEVLYVPDEDHPQLGVVKEILPRKNYIVRESPQNRKHQQHIIASNLDLAVILATLEHPRTSLGFIDRFLITAEAYQIPALLVYNKIDLHRKEDTDYLHYIQSIYEQAGYKVMAVSAHTGEGIDLLGSYLKGKTTLFSGHSGVGKSSILNALMGSNIQKVSDISEWSGKGKHTTTFAQMMDLPNGGSIIDTPGVKEFGLYDIVQDELAEFFPELRSKINQCKFNNCRHIAEPGCAVKQAVDQGEISEERYLSYLQIRETLPARIY